MLGDPNSDAAFLPARQLNSDADVTTFRAFDLTCLSVATRQPDRLIDVTFHSERMRQPDTLTALAFFSTAERQNHL